MNTEKYEAIHRNIVDCLANMRVVDFLLDHVDYRKCLIERHHKFVASYFKFKKNFSILAKSYNFSDKDMLRIFWRIQRKLMMHFIEEAGKGNIKIISEKPESFDLFLMWQLEQFRDDSKEVFEYIQRRMTVVYDIDGVTESRAQKISEILKELHRVENLEDVMPKHVYPVAKDLLNGKAFTEVVKDHKRSLNYMVTSIIGTKNPRSASERGWLQYIGKEKKPGKKLLDFPRKAR